MWAKGNLHTHTTVSDGDAPPREVCRYYADHGYHFLAISDHMARVDPSEFSDIPILLIPAEEMQNTAEEDPHAPLHINGFGLGKTLSTSPSQTKAGAIQNCVDEIVNSGGIAQINHPNFYYAFDHRVISQINNCRLLEIYNGHPLVYNRGDENHIAVEAMWDILLSQGLTFYGTAVDDTHHIKGEFSANRANPLRGWVYVRTAELTVSNIIAALQRGDFYASTGVELRELRYEGSTIHLAIHQDEAMGYLTEYISNNGRLLHSTKALSSSFELPQDKSYTYIRARITAHSGATAWTQPLFKHM